MPAHVHRCRRSPVPDLTLPAGAVITAYAVGFVGRRSPGFTVFTTVDN